MNKEEIMEVAKAIRGFLLEEFPETPNLRNQCKRASILFDLYCKQKKIKSYPTAGFITKKNDKNDYNRGHVWNVVNLDGEKYLLDITLTQFREYLKVDIPEVLFMEYKEAKKMYSCQPDGYGKYRYHREDVRRNLVEKVEKMD